MRRVATQSREYAAYGRRKSWAVVPVHDLRDSRFPRRALHGSTPSGYRIHRFKRVGRFRYSESGWMSGASRRGMRTGVAGNAAHGEGRRNAYSGRADSRCTRHHCGWALRRRSTRRGGLPRCRRVDRRSPRRRRRSARGHDRFFREQSQCPCRDRRVRATLRRPRGRTEFGHRHRSAGTVMLPGSGVGARLAADTPRNTVPSARFRQR